MKRILLCIFVFVVVILAAQQDPGFALRIDSFRVPPVDVSGYTHYDYMHGGRH